MTWQVTGSGSKSAGKGRERRGRSPRSVRDVPVEREQHPDPGRVHEYRRLRVGVTQKRRKRPSAADRELEVREALPAPEAPRERLAQRGPERAAVVPRGHERPAARVARRHVRKDRRRQVAPVEAACGSGAGVGSSAAGSWRRRGCRVDCPRGRVAATPRVPRGSSVDGSRRRRGCHVDRPGGRVAATPRVPSGSSEGAVRGDAVGATWRVRGACAVHFGGAAVRGSSITARRSDRRDLGTRSPTQSFRQSASTARRRDAFSSAKITAATAQRSHVAWSHHSAPQPQCWLARRSKGADGPPQVTSQTGSASQSKVASTSVQFSADASHLGTASDRSEGMGTDRTGPRGREPTGPVRGDGSRRRRGARAGYSEPDIPKTDRGEPISTERSRTRARSTRRTRCISKAPNEAAPSAHAVSESASPTRPYASWSPPTS